MTPVRLRDEETPAPTHGRGKPRPRLRVKLIFSLALTFLVLLFVLLYVLDHLEEFRAILSRDISVSSILGVCVSIALLYLFNGQILRQAQRVHSLDLPFWENLALTYATSAINYYLPLKGAMGLRAYYLKTQFKLPVTDFLSQITLIGLISLCLSSFFALIGLLQMGVQGRLGTILCLYFLAVCLLGTSLIFVAKLPFKLPKFLTGPLNSWDSFRQNPRTLISIVCLDILYYLMWCLGHWFSLRSFNIHLNLWETLFYAGGQIHSLLINLTPAGLGVMEAFSVFAGQILNFSPAEALLAQGLNRFSAICVLGVLGTISWGYLLYLKRKKSKNLDS